jgi:DNA primase catalytic core
MIEQTDIDKILELDIVNVIGKYITLKKKGVNYQACCPLHGEKTPSFSVSSVKGIFKCFGCGKGGNLITFVMENEKLSFPEAVKKIASDHHISITEKEPTEEERRVEDQREKLLIANEIASKYFIENLYEPSNANAFEYALNRFKKETLEAFGIGFAIDDWHGLQNHAHKNNLKDEVLLGAGLISKSKEKTFDFFKGRLMFPIHNRYGRIIAFSGRSLTDSKETPKYINTPETLCYHKSNALYGVHLAFKAIRTKDSANLVEGNTDVMRLHDIEIDNTIGTCGTALTLEHIEQIKRLTQNVTIIFDGDRPGEKATIRAGKLLIDAQLNCFVIRLPMGEEKTDPDKYFVTTKVFEEYEKLNKKSFIIWYANILNEKYGTEPEGRSKFISEVAELIAKLPNEVIRDSYVENIAKKFKIKEKQLKQAVAKLNKIEGEEEKESNIPEYILLTDYEKYGFYEDRNCYYFKGKFGFPAQASNFVLHPLFHIESVLNAKRIFEIVNEFGYTRVIELLQRDLISLGAFKVRVESLGNFVWLGQESDLNRLKSYIYEKTQTCTEIVQLGWQPKSGFFAWGNGIFNGEFNPINELGIVTHNEKNYYIPAYSSIYKNEDNLFVSERKFVHIAGKVSIHDYVKQLMIVYDNNALVGFSFFIATLFRDWLVRKFSFFPIVNLFGPKGAGKTEMALSLLQLFGKLPKGPNINSTSKPALADHVSQFHNALCHIDEYKNNIEFEKIEFLKGIWDGTGRTRMNMEKDKKKETTAVDIGLMLTGQEMPTADIALFSRLVFLTFTQIEFSEEEKEELEKLKAIERQGLTHITEYILNLRQYFIDNFDSSYTRVSEDLIKELGQVIIEDRIYKNWCIIATAFATLEIHLKLPIQYKDTIKIFAALLLQQNRETKKSNEISTFWNMVEYLLRDGLIEEEIDFRIDCIHILKTDKAEFEWNEPREVLYLNHARIIPLYRKHGQLMKENVLPVKTLEYYLINDKRFLGRKLSVSFKSKVLKEVIELGATVQRAARTITTAMVFDYKSLDINLSSEI